MKYISFFLNIQKIFNLTYSLNLLNIDGIFDAIIVDKFLNRKIPDNLSTEDYDNLHHLIYF
jgi:hypothetical protein